MDSNDYRELRRLFHEIQESGLCGDDRSAFLERAQLSADLRLELDRLLRLAEHDTGNFIPNVPVPATRQLEMPEQLGPYRIQEEIGRGGMGIVHAAIDGRLERRVALKRLPHGGPLPHGDFQREAQLLASLNHPNVATIFSFEEIDEIAFCTLELVEGESLADQLIRGPLDPRSLSAIGRQICLGLDAAHEAGVVHLDLKPANVMVDTRGRVKILDFGIGRRLQDEDGSARPIAGTPGYMSPEQLRGDRVDERSDLWSLGSVLYECATGEPAVPPGTLDEMVRQTLDAPIAIRQRALLSPAGIEVLRSLMHPIPSSRPRSAEDARQRIDRWIASDLATVDPGGDVPPAKNDPRLGRIRSATQIPPVLTDLIGRESIVPDIRGALLSHRVVTLVGFGGVGKTRLAVEIARNFDGDAIWVPLSSLREGDRLELAIARSLGLDDSNHDPIDAIANAIGDSAPLITLDNCEQIVDDAARVVRELCNRCPNATVLVTSRERLHVAAERTIDVEPLAMGPRSRRELIGDSATLVSPAELVSPTASSSPREWPAVRLFVDRATSLGVTISDEDLPRVVDICQRLDGFPLAIELATSRLRALSIRDLSDRLERRFDLLKSRRTDGPQHHRTLRTAIEWSVDLLDPSERRLLGRLSVFADGWTLHAAESVLDDEALESWTILDHMTSLVEKSLVQVVRTEGDGLQYRMWESVREFACELCLERDEEAVFVRRFTEFYAEEAEAIMLGVEGVDPRPWLERGEQLQGNFFAAIDHSMAGRVGPVGVEALRIGSALFTFWEIRGYQRTGAKILEDALAVVRKSSTTGASTRIMARALNAAANLLEALGENDLALEREEECVTLCREIGDASKTGIALVNCGIMLKRLGRLEAAVARYHDAITIAEEHSDSKLEGLARLNLSILQRECGNDDLGRDNLLRARSLAIERRDTHSLAYCESSLGLMAFDLGDDVEAESRLKAAKVAFGELGDVPSLARVASNLSLIAARRGDDVGAEELLREALRSHRETGSRRGEAIALVNLVPNAARQSRQDRTRLARGKTWLAECLRILIEIDDLRVLAYAIEATATLCAAHDDLRRAVTFAAAAKRHRETTSQPMPKLERQESEAVLETWRLELSDVTFDEAWELGRSLATAAATRSALEWATGEPSDE